MNILERIIPYIILPAIIAIALILMTVMLVPAIEKLKIEPDNPDLSQTERFEFELRYETNRGCRYEIFAVTRNKRQKVGYIFNHCKYDDTVIYPFILQPVEREE